MQIQAGTRLGPYEIVSRIGAGGMGEVWSARDSRLDRSVAIKVLPAELAHDAQLKLRFDREARTISQLEHPHICRLYDVGDDYLVMELLDGESLADRLAKGPLPISDVLRYGMQIAEALDRAHRAGIVHRDLKPGNVMITRSGAKLLDFGLARSGLGSALILSGATEATAHHDPTLHRPLTEEGTIIGTFQYMAPEQLEGEEADARTDIFALGALLYEMASGRRAFEGKTKTSLIAAIVSTDPKPVSELQPLAPPALEHIIRKCLSKDPENRWQSAHDIADELRWIGEAGSQAGIAPTIAVRRVHRERLAWAIAAVATAAALLAGAGYLRRAPQPEPARRFILPLPADHSVNRYDELGVALSPDGQQLAFVTDGPDGKRQLSLRSFSEFTSQVIPETANASYPFWSPDGKFIAYFAAGKLRKIEAAGGPPQIICDAPTGRGGTWGADGTILFAPNVYSAIYRVSANGGTPTPVTRVNEATEMTHRWPLILPDGKHFLYVVRPKDGATGRGTGRLMVGSLDSPETKQLMSDATNSMVMHGHLLFGREQRLMAQKIDLDALELVGDPFVLVGEKLSYWDPKNLIVFSATESGSLVYLPELAPLADLSLVDRNGKLIETIADNAILNQGARFSPDGSRVAYSLGDPTSGLEDIWLWDAVRKRTTRFTFQPGTYYSFTWAPDSSSLFFGAAPESLGSIYQKPLKGSASITPVIANGFWQLGGTVSPDGSTIVYAQQSADSGYDLWKMKFGSKPEIFLRTPFEEADPEYSPDGRWISYTSSESGRLEIHVRPAAGTPDQWQVSTGGGAGARWRADGREIVYIAPDGKVFAVMVQTSPAFESGDTRELFDLGSSSSLADIRLQDISPDGQQFLTMTSSNSDPAAFHVVLNWQNALAK